VTTPPIKVLIVDDSAFARKVLRDTLSASPQIDVIGFARDGLEALERIAELKPDVVTLDLVMPNLDGVGVLAALPLASAPRVVIVSMADGDSALGIAALRAGAVELVHKPTSLATDQLYELGDELIAKVLAAAGARPQRVSDEPSTPVALPRPLGTSKRVLVIGASTGGPQAVTRLLKQLPAEFPLPVAIVVHMPPGYTRAFAERLNEQCALEVVEASDDLVLRPGLVVLARAGIHLKLVREGDRFRTRLDVRPVGAPHSPSVNALFESVAGGGSDVIGVVLTGMGDDGTVGAGTIHKAGGTILTETEASCVVYGMPRSVVEAGFSDEAVAIDAMVEAIVRHL
jgi:two-component system chemotaxis response regulator CheB